MLVTRRRSTARPARGDLSDHHGDVLALVVYELLDAHDDTMRLGEGLEGDLRWRAHLDYLRGLQRVGREALARGTAGEPARSTRRPADLFRRFRRPPASTEIAIP
ncbi:MAG: hypothetical protein ACXVHB_33965 [Solirubrobacteraceae bacterium]